MVVRKQKVVVVVAEQENGSRKGGAEIGQTEVPYTTPLKRE